MAEKFSFGAVDTDTLKAAQDAAEGPRFEPLPAGWYDVSIKEAKIKLYGENSKNRGKPSVNLQLYVTSGPYTKRIVFTQVPLFDKWGPTEKNPNGFPTVFPLLRQAVGLTGESEFSSVDDFANSLLGEQIQAKITVGDDEYSFRKAKDSDPSAKQEDFKRNEVRDFKPEGTNPTATGEPTTKRKVREL